MVESLGWPATEAPATLRLEPARPSGDVLGLRLERPCELGSQSVPDQIVDRSAVEELEQAAAARTLRGDRGERLAVGVRPHLSADRLELGPSGRVLGGEPVREVRD